MKTNYVVGFAFNKEKTKLLLIKKTKPEWQAGLLNGIGGKIENYDSTPYHAMTREFFEESNIQTTKESWYLFGKLDSPYFELHCFAGFFDEEYLTTYENMTEETIELLNVEDLFNQQFSGCVSNLKWLVSIALDADLYRMYIEGKYIEN